MTNPLRNLFRKSAPPWPRWGERFAQLPPGQSILGRVGRLRVKAIIAGRRPTVLRLTTLDLLELAELVNSQRQPVVPSSLLPRDHNSTMVLMEHIDGLKVMWDSTLAETAVE